MRKAIAMIELIFAIVVIAISVITIPTMMAVSNNANKTMILDDDAMIRLKSIATEKFQARWDGSYILDRNDTQTWYISVLPINSGDFNCTDGKRAVGSALKTNRDCNMSQIAHDIPLPKGSGDVSDGIEQVNGGTETIEIQRSDGNSTAYYEMNAAYSVRYVPFNLDKSTPHMIRAKWTLGSSTSLNVGGSTTANSHLKRVSIRFFNDDLGVDTTLSFFKSNIGVANE